MGNMFKRGGIIYGEIGSEVRSWPLILLVFGK